MICLDELGPEAAKSHPGSAVVRPDPTGERRVRAKQEIDYGRRGKGYVFGAFRPATGEALTVPYEGRTIANWTDFLERVDGWGDAAVERVYAVLDNLSTHRAVDALLWALNASNLILRRDGCGSCQNGDSTSRLAEPRGWQRSTHHATSRWKHLAHPRWEFVFQPTYAAYLNLIEPWWKVLRSLALKGRRFATWEEVRQAVEQATSYWNNHRHPFVWGRRRKRRRPARPAGVARLPMAA